MTTIDDRKRVFEDKYARDQEFAFRVESRASRLIGLWVAEKIGLSGDDAATYAREVVSANLDEPGLDDVLRKVRGDLDAKGIALSDHLLRKQMDALLEQAKDQIFEEKGIQ